MKLFPSILVLPSAYLAYGEALAPEAQQELAKKLGVMAQAQIIHNVILGLLTNGNL
jgi:hypothetical protein